MKLQILFAGIDGSGKSTCLNLLISRLEPKYRILKLGNYDPYIYFKGKKHRFLKYNAYILLERIGKILFKTPLYSAFLVFNFTYKYALEKYIQIFKQADITLYETDTLLHPAVYATYHLPFTRMLSARFRFTLVNAFFGSRKNFLILYLDIDPATAVDRIGKRNKPIEPHENIQDLGKLKQEFDKILAVALQSGLEIVTIKTDNKNKEEIASEAEHALYRKLHPAL